MTSTQLDDLREHSLDAVRDVFELAPARRALRWSPLRRNDLRRLHELEERINLGARAARHVRSIGRDVADMRVRNEELAATTRHLADALDRALVGHDRTEAIARAEQALAAAAADGDQVVVAAQLRQPWPTCARAAQTQRATPARGNQTEQHEERPGETEDERRHPAAPAGAFGTEAKRGRASTPA